METQTEGTRTDRRKVVIIVAVIAVVIIVLVIFLLTRSDSKKTAAVGDTPTTTVAPTTTAPTTTAANTRTLPPLSFRLMSSGGPSGYTVSGSTCSGIGRYASATRGGTVIVRNEAEEELTRTTLAEGVASPEGCTFTTVGPVTVPKADNYVVEFPGFPTLPVSVADIESSAASGQPLFGVKDQYGRGPGN